TYSEDRFNLARNLILRNDINKYLETNKSKMTSVEYQSVVQAYDKLVEKCNEDFKGADGDAYFDAMEWTVKKRISNPDEGYNAESASRDVVAIYYLASLKREYKAADSLSREENEAEKEAASKWKENVLKKLYSGTFDDDLDKFIKEDEIGKTVYGYCKNHFTYIGASVGYDDKDIDYHIGIINADLARIVYEKNSEAGKLEIKDEADKQKGLDLIYEAERIRDVANQTVSAVSSKRIEFDSRITKIIKNLLGTFNNKLSDARKKMEEEYNAQIKSEMDAQLAEQDKKIQAVQREKNAADSEFLKAKKEYNNQKKIFDRAKNNYEKMKKIGFIDKDDQLVNEGVFKREQDVMNTVSEKHGIAASKASKISQELERLENEKRIMSENLEKAYKEKRENNPYKTKTNVLEDAGIIKNVEKKLDNGKTIETIELVDPFTVKINRILDVYQCAKVLSKDEVNELLQIENDNFNLLMTAHKDIPVKNTVGEIVEPGVLALEERNRQLSQSEPQAKEEVPAKEDHSGEKEVQEEDNELDDTPLDIDEESLHVEITSNQRAQQTTTSYSEAHKGMLGLEAGVASLNAAQKGVWGGSKEYDNIVTSLKAIQELEEYQNQNEETFDETDLESRRATLLAAKKQLAVEMKHYISRKNEEKNAAERNDKKENEHSQFRRETMGSVLGLLEEHIHADEVAMGIENRDKIYEDMSYELHYLADKYKRDPNIPVVAREFDKLEADIPENLPANELLNRSQKCLNYIITIISKTKNDKLKNEMIELADKFGTHFVKGVAEYRPESLEGVKESIRGNNALLGTSINTSTKAVTENFNSYDELKAYQQRQMQDGVKKIFREEESKKNFISEWTMYDEIDGERSYQYTPGDEQKKVEGHITKLALKIIYADQLQKNNIIFDPKTINEKCDEFVNEMSNYKIFNTRFMNHLCSDMKKVENSSDPYSVDMSYEKITQAKSAVFQEILVNEISKLTAKMKENKGKEEIQSSLDELGNLEKISKLVGTQEVYNNKVKVNGQEIEIKELSNLAVKKAQKAISPKQSAKKHEQAKEMGGAVNGPGPKM
ncbi:MAG: hypothetical protein K6F60_04670, partial [Eubacterium sp.]|nr:hypothetical protein [Eubacterium sp.]